MVKLPDFKNCTVLVVGDVMLDQYYWGDVERISPEAPVPVFKVNDKTETLGGAGNVALNIKGLGADCLLMGVLGNDTSARILRAILEKSGIENELIKTSTKPTTTKTRILGQGQQLIRLDQEETGKLDNKIYKKLLKKFKDLLPKANAVIISDYGKGMFGEDLETEIIDKCNSMRVPVFIDPKGIDWERYRGATCVTPNTSEFNLVSPDSDKSSESFSYRAKQLIDKLGLKYLLVTKGAKGMSLFSAHDEDVNVSSHAREVFDVSGAGDTVISTLACAVGCGLKMAEAVELANLAAGIVVGKVGTQPISARELEGAVSKTGIDGVNKISTFQQAREMVSKWRSEGKRIVFTNGCFDILHIGHVKLLHAAAEQGQKLVVALNSDASIRRLKGPERPVMLEDERAAILSSIKCVDLIVIFEEDTPVEMIRAFRPDVIVKGGDYTPETVVGHEIVEGTGGRVVIFPLVEGMSSTNIIEKMRNHKQ